jgi:hypothetical protein
MVIGGDEVRQIEPNVFEDGLELRLLICPEALHNAFALEGHRGGDEI